MERLPHASLLLAALFGLTACSIPFGYSLELKTGRDQLDGDDHLYFVSERVDGLGSGLSALVIPSHWKGEPMVEIAPGVFELAQPISLSWISGKENLPEARRSSPGFLPIIAHWSGEPEAWVHMQPRSYRLGLEEEPSTPELETYSYDKIHERLTAGQDAYILVPHQRVLKDGFDVFAAAGPPLMWVRLGTGSAAWGL